MKKRSHNLNYDGKKKRGAWYFICICICICMCLKYKIVYGVYRNRIACTRSCLYYSFLIWYVYLRKYHTHTHMLFHFVRWHIESSPHRWYLSHIQKPFQHSLLLLPYSTIADKMIGWLCSKSFAFKRTIFRHSFSKLHLVLSTKSHLKLCPNPFF